MRQLMERLVQFNRDLFQLFIDFRQAFDLIWRKGLWHVLRRYGVPDVIVSIIEDIGSQFKCQVLTTMGSLVNSKLLLESFKDASSYCTGLTRFCLLSSP